MYPTFSAVNNNIVQLKSIHYATGLWRTSLNDKHRTQDQLKASWSDLDKKRFLSAANPTPRDLDVATKDKSAFTLLMTVEMAVIQMKASDTMKAVKQWFRS